MTVGQQVIVAGAGPVGLTLAIDLGRRGVEVLLLERDETTKPFPKMDRSNARTMELYRRIGIADRVRVVGYPPEIPMDVFIVNRLSDPPLAILEYPSVAEYRDLIDATNDGTMPLEPYQLVSQNDLEPLLVEVARETTGVTVAFGRELVSFDQDDTGVTVEARHSSGEVERLRAAYLVGTDGGSSTVRRQLGIELSGQGGLNQQTQVIFGSENLFDRIPIGKGRHYNFTDPAVTTLVVQGSRREFTAHTRLEPDDDLEGAIRRVVGFDFDMEIRHVIPWRQHLLVADRFRHGRVFLSGDAVHLVIPTGGLGMNSGVGDAFDLSWKLAAGLQGWGGPGLLDGYEAERRPVALRNVEASGWAAAGVPVWRALVRPHIVDDGPEGEALRREVGAVATVEHARMHGMVGVEMGYSYAGSDLVAVEPGNRPEWEISSYAPHTRPGVRLPHVRTADGTPMQDLMGDGYTIVDLTGGTDGRPDGALDPVVDVEPLRAAFERIGAPVTVVSRDEPDVRRVYGCTVLVLRPDLHVAWRGDDAPAPGTEHGLVAMATGHGPPVASGLEGDTGSGGAVFVGFGPRRAFRSGPREEPSSGASGPGLRPPSA